MRYAPGRTKSSLTRDWWRPGSALHEGAASQQGIRKSGSWCTTGARPPGECARACGDTPQLHLGLSLFSTI